MKAKTRRRYLGTIFNYLKWSTESNFMKPEIKYSNKAPDAVECMFNWESLGTTIKECREPDQLARIIQGKQLRDWHITEYRDGISKQLFTAWEFVGVGDITIDNCIDILLTNNKLNIPKQQLLDWGNNTPLYQRVQASNINKEDLLLLYNLIMHPGKSVLKWDPYYYYQVFNTKPEYQELIYQQILELEEHLQQISILNQQIRTKYDL